MPTTLNPMSRSRKVFVAATYGLSLGVLVLQLLAFRGSGLGYVIFVVLHAAAFWFVILRPIVASRIGRWCALIAAACIIGAIPYWPTWAILVPMNVHGNDAFSSLTRNLPYGARLLYEVGLFPIVQLGILYVASRLERAR